MSSRRTFDEHNGMIASFRSLLQEGCDVDTALMQVGFEHGLEPEEAEAQLEITLGDLHLYAVHFQNRGGT